MTDKMPDEIWCNIYPINTYSLSKRKRRPEDKDRVQYTRADLVIRKDDKALDMVEEIVEWAIYVLRPVEAAFAHNSNTALEFRSMIATANKALTELKKLRGQYEI